MIGVTWTTRELEPNEPQMQGRFHVAQAVFGLEPILVAQGDLTGMTRSASGAMYLVPPRRLSECACRCSR